MAMNFDLNRLRSIARGEVNGSIPFMLTLLGAFVVWISIYWLSGSETSAAASLKLQQGRHATLAQLAADYKAMNVKSLEGARDADALSAFSQVSSQLILGDRVNKIAPSSDGRTLSVEVSRLYAEELTDMIRSLDSRGYRFRSAVLRAVPVGKDRLFNLTAIVDSKK